MPVVHSAFFSLAVSNNPLHTTFNYWNHLPVYSTSRKCVIQSSNVKKPSLVSANCKLRLQTKHSSLSVTTGLRREFHLRLQKHKASNQEELRQMQQTMSTSRLYQDVPCRRFSVTTPKHPETPAFCQDFPFPSLMHICRKWSAVRRLTLGNTRKGPWTPGSGSGRRQSESGKRYQA